MPHCYAHPTLQSTQQLVVPVKFTFLKKTENSETKENICICEDARHYFLKWTNRIAGLLQLVDAIFQLMFNVNADVNWKGCIHRKNKLIKDL